MSDPRVVLTLSALVGLGVLGVAQRRFNSKEPDYGFLLIPLLFAVAIWVPREIRDFTLPVMCGLLLFVESVMAGCVVASVVFCVGLIVPGGATVALLLVFAVVGFFSARNSVRHLVRMRTARGLEPGERPRGDVEIGGRVVATRALALPGSESTCAAWWFDSSGSEDCTSEVPFQVRAEAGTMIVYPSAVRPGMENERLSFLTEDSAQAVFKSLEIVPDMTDDEPAVWLWWLEDGDEVYVVGRPTWEAAPPGVASTYRDSPVLPTFRAETETKAFITTGSEEQERLRSLWSLWQWAVWGAVCAMIALTQMIVE